MMLQFFGIVRFILFGQIIFLTRFINAFPEELTTTIVDENGIEIELKWLKTNQFLANEHLPIWRAQTQTRLHQDTQVMKTLGNFKTYHDLEKSSAVIYLEKTDSLYGVIGSKYFLAGFPVKKLHQKHTVGQIDYLISLSEEIQTLLSHINNDKPSISNMDPKSIPLKKRPYVDNKASTSCDDSNSLYGKRPRFNEKHDSPHTSENNSDKPSTSKIHLTSELDKYIDENSENKPLGPFYPEILLLVSHNLMKTRNPEFSLGDNLEGDIIYYLILMNAVSMLYAKLAKNVEININIAGIIFEETAGAFPFSTSQYVNGQLICQNQQLISDSISNYISDVKFVHGKRLFSEDSFDFFVFMTEFNHMKNHHEEISRGISTEFFDVYNQRLSAKLSSRATAKAFYANFKITKFLGSIIDNTVILQTYIDTAREIAHLMNINDDDVKSHTIMEINAFNSCEDCLKWSPESIEGFKHYFSQNKNRCFLLNEPRSLHAFDTPRKTLSIQDQCICYGYKSTSKMGHDLHFLPLSNSCRIRLPCLQYYLIPGKTYESYYTPKSVPYPVDGTPCAGPNKVCWKKRCVHRAINI